ncbi:carbohydrate ABC transporter permease [Halopelagius longus]|uniref:Carbohydrate ABC transporter membrane protein 1, CUT1 family n=1 Tax=Halopelagius longus TaxID=1236180 RepID=A0A1H1G6B9_9EURY|nr:sugar ABC transporter permease [Halopelagius longus]RDI69822.1 sugar ABC transporter permease [Halopelagius longus]SDR08625.1 carbohydrate ABC transporter membrane protein 1, CUT1 family [Halopelagius longus]
MVLNAIQSRVRSSGAYRRLADQFRYRRQRVSDVVPRIPALPYLYISPFFVLFGIFLLFPTAYTLYLSFFEYLGSSNAVLLTVDLGVLQIAIPQIAELEFVGLSHYERLLFQDSLFHKSLFNTSFIFLIQVPLMVVLGLATALVLDAKFIRAKGLFRTLIALPVATGLVAYSTIFLLLFNGDVGLVNYVLQSLGADAIPWLGDAWWARITLVIAVTWRWLGYNMIILLAGLQTVPEQLYEAAEVDGATRWQKFRYVTLPQLRPVLLFVVVSSTIGTFQIFAEPFVITGGGPSNATITMVQYIYRQAFLQLNLGYASAVSVALVVLVSIMSIIQIQYGGTE